MTLELLVNVDVDDLAKAERFYCDAFGLKVRRRFGDFGVELAGTSSALFLLAKPAGSAAAATTGQRRDYNRHWTPVHIDLVIADLDAALARAERAGAVRETDVQTHDWGRIVGLADPFGHGLCLIQFLGRGYDEIATDVA